MCCNQPPTVVKVLWIKILLKINLKFSEAYFLVAKVFYNYKCPSGFEGKAIFSAKDKLNITSLVTQTLSPSHHFLNENNIYFCYGFIDCSPRPKEAKESFVCRSKYSTIKVGPTATDWSVY